MEENKSRNTLLYIIGGLIVGGLIVYFLLKSKSQQPIQTQSQLSSQQIQTQFTSLKDKLLLIEEKLQTLQSIQLNQSTNNSTNIPIDNAINTTYKNSEKTNFILNKDGDIIGIETIRDAKIN